MLHTRTVYPYPKAAIIGQEGTQLLWRKTKDKHKLF